MSILLSLQGGGGGPTIVETDANAAGIAEALGIAAAIWNAGGGGADGVGAASGVAAALSVGVGASDGVGAASGAGAALWLSKAETSGIATSSGDANALWASLGSADGSSVALGEAERVVAPTPAGALRRRRYIMPDGTMLEATTQEAYELLRLYSRPAVEEKQAKRPAVRSVRMPQIVLEKRDVRFIPATDAALDTWKAVISERFSYQPPPGVTRQAEILANRMRADEEAIIALLM